MDPSVWSLQIYDKVLAFQGFVGAAEIVCTPRFNDTSTLSLTLDADAYAAPLLAAHGARLVAFKNGRRIMSGKVTLQSVDDIATGGTFTFTVEGDFRLLKNILAYPVPDHTTTGAVVNGQNVAYRSLTGPAETVVKTIIAENLARVASSGSAGAAFASKYRVAPDLGRGKSSRYTFRMHPFYDRMFPAVEQAGLGVSVIQEGAEIVIDVYEPRTYPHVLSVENGTLADGSGTLASPTLTRTIVGGQGEGVERDFKQYFDPVRELAHGDVIETLVDARDSSSGDVYKDRADEALKEGSQRAGYSLKLLESDNFGYGADGVKEGDRVSIRVGQLIVTDVVREVVLTLDNNGPNTEPIIGERADDPTAKIINTIRRLAAGDRDRKAH